MLGTRAQRGELALLTDQSLQVGGRVVTLLKLTHAMWPHLGIPAADEKDEA
jgi:hypothetical protein